MKIRIEIESGDSLIDITRRIVGEEHGYKQLFPANEDRIKDEDLIYPGQILNVPDSWKLQATVEN